MAKKSSAKQKNIFEQYRHYLIPSTIGGVIAWFYSGSFELGVIVFIGVWAGNWVGKELLKKK